MHKTNNNFPEKLPCSVKHRSENFSGVKILPRKWSRFTIVTKAISFPCTYRIYSRICMVPDPETHMNVEVAVPAIAQLTKTSLPTLIIARISGINSAWQAQKDMQPLNAVGEIAERNRGRNES